MNRHFFLSALSLGAAALFGQSDRGAIAGAAVDVAGAAIPGVSVTAVHIETNRPFKGTAGESGDFSLTSLPLGLYRVTIEKAGFQPVIHNNVTVEVGGTVRLDTRLEIGTMRQAVIVSAESSQLQTDNAKVQNTISDVMIEGLPTVVAGNMRSPFDLAGITA